MSLHEELPETGLSRRVDPILTWIGHSISWLWLVLLATIIVNVVLRYAFGEGRIEFEEFQWHLYSTGFLLGMGYTFQVDRHVRVDVLHERLPRRLQAWLEPVSYTHLTLPTNREV